MKTPFHLRSLAVLLLYLSSAFTVRATHLLGADITYTYEGTVTNPYQYHVQVQLFHDLNSLVDEPSIVLTCGSNGCGPSLPGSFTTTLLRTHKETVASSCAFRYIYYGISTLEGNIVLPPAQWTLSIEGTNRGSNILNMVQSNSQTMYVKAELDNRTQLINASPRFTSNQLIQLSSVQAQQRYSLNAFDAEGDSLTYQLVQPMAAPSATAACGNPIAGTIAPHFQIDGASGALITTNGPAQQGSYALAGRVDEYRRVGGNWQKIGSITRDMTYVLLIANNQPPAFTRVSFTGNPTSQLLGQTIRVNPGQTLALTLTAADADAGQVVRVSSLLNTVVPGTTFQSLPNGQAQLTWQVPPTLRPGTYYLTATATDDACTFPGSQVLLQPVQVTTQALATRQRQALAQLPYPTPFQEAVQFRLAGPGQQPVTITDGLGRTVAQLQTAADGSLTWRPAPALTAGLYFARTPDGTQVARLAYAGR